MALDAAPRGRYGGLATPRPGHRPPRSCGSWTLHRGGSRRESRRLRPRAPRRCARGRPGDRSRPRARTHLTRRNRFRASPRVPAVALRCRGPGAPQDGCCRGVASALGITSPPVRRAAGWLALARAGGPALGRRARRGGAGTPPRRAALGPRATAQSRPLALSAARRSREHRIGGLAAHAPRLHTLQEPEREEGQDDLRVVDEALLELPVRFSAGVPCRPPRADERAGARYALAE